jgi:anti-sigma factor RsiW
MTDQDSVLELINAEIDGVLSGPQRAELNRLLLADPAVRALRDDLTRTCRAIDALPPEELPEGLHAAIVARLPLAPPVCTETSRKSFSRARVLRYAASFAGGVLVSALAFQLGGLDSSQVGAGQLAGTIADSSDTRSLMVVDHAQVHGSITLTGSADAPAVITSLHASEPVLVVTRLQSDGSVEVQVLDDASSSLLQRGTLRAESDR